MATRRRAAAASPTREGPASAGSEAKRARAADTAGPQAPPAPPLGLTPYTKLPSQMLTRNVTLLLVGTTGAGKQTLGKLLLKAAQQRAVRVDVRTAAQLPLPPDPSNQRPRIDVVVFLVNLTSALSLAQLRANLGVVDPGFLLGRACIVATHADNVASYAFEPALLEQLSFDFELPVFYGDLAEAVSGGTAAEHVLSLGLLAGRQTAGLSPLLLRSSMTSYVATTVEPA